jgi:hypothetical protein
MPLKGAGEWRSALSVALRNPVTGEPKIQQDGWSWICFLGSGLLGLPLFRRGLMVWGSIMVVFNFTVLILEFVPIDNAPTLESWVSVAAIASGVFFGLKANEMAINRYLTLGWEYADRRQNWVR